MAAEDEELSKEEQMELAAEISSEVIDIINKVLIPLHHSGKLGAGTMIYIGTIALAMSTSTLMFDQLPDGTNNPETIEKLIQGQERIFRGCVRQILSGEAAEPEAEPKESLWSKKEKE